jgi:RNA polymerase sigma-70 factor (ECF subfamily)
MPLEQSPEISLMLKVRQGDECAFEALHGLYQQRVLNFFHGLSRDGALANDLCQETFLRVWKIRKRYRATGSFPAYLFGVGRMIWLEYLRRQQRVRRLGVRSEAGAEETAPDRYELRPDYRAARTEAEARIFHALDQLPEEQRMVFVLRNIEGLSLDDIATALDCPINTVRSRKILAIKKLRHLLSEAFSSRLDRVL